MDTLTKEIEKAIRNGDAEHFIATHEYYKNLIIAHLQEHNLRQASLISNEFNMVFSNLKIHDPLLIRQVYHLFPVNSVSAFYSLQSDPLLAEDIIDKKVSFPSCLHDRNNSYYLTKYVWQYKDTTLLEKLIKTWSEMKQANDLGNNHESIQTAINYCLKTASEVNRVNFQVSEDIDRISAFESKVQHESKISDEDLLPLAKSNFKYFVSYMLRQGQLSVRNKTKRTDVTHAIEICLPEIENLDHALVYLWGTKGLIKLSEKNMDQIFFQPKFDFEDLLEGIRSSDENFFGAFRDSDSINILAKQMKFDFFNDARYTENLSRLIDTIINKIVERRSDKVAKKKTFNADSVTPNSVMESLVSQASDKVKMELLLNLSHHRKRQRLEEDLSL